MRYFFLPSKKCAVGCRLFLFFSPGFWNCGALQRPRTSFLGDCSVRPVVPWVGSTMHRHKNLTRSSGSVASHIYLCVYGCTWSTAYCTSHKIMDRCPFHGSSYVGLQVVHKRGSNYSLICYAGTHSSTLRLLSAHLGLDSGQSKFSSV